MTRLRDVVELRSEKVQPSEAQDSTYIGLEHIQQQMLALSGVGRGADVSSQKQRFYRGDVLFGKLRPYFRKVILAQEEGICSTDIWVVRPKDDADSAFILYLLASEKFIEEATNTSEGSRMPRANWRVMSDYEFPDFTAHERAKIGQLLSLFDEKIRENRRASALLEKTAQSLFKSWFIDFDPVKAKIAGDAPVGMDAVTAALFPDSMEESEIGAIPKGWVVAGLDEFAEQRKEQAGISTLDSGVNYLGLEHLPRKSLFLTTWGSSEKVKSAKSHFKENDILFGKLRPYFHKVVVAPIDGACSTDIVVIRSPDGMASPFVACFVSGVEFVDFVSNRATGSRMPRTSWAEMCAYKTAFPGPEIVQKFNELLEPFFRQALTLGRQSNSLKAMRDALLPRLISGELKIPDEMLAA